MAQVRSSGLLKSVTSDVITCLNLYSFVRDTWSGQGVSGQNDFVYAPGSLSVITCSPLGLLASELPTRLHTADSTYTPDLQTIRSDQPVSIINVYAQTLDKIATYISRYVVDSVN
jgi:hypothetical protein